MDVSQYLEIFIDETKEHLQNLNEQLLVLEKEPENTDTINEIFRAAHSLKGMAGTMGFKRMQRLTHDMENVFSEIRNGKFKVTAPMVDVLFRGLDALENYLDNVVSSGDEGEEDNEDVINDLNAFLNGGSAAPDKKAETSSATPAASDEDMGESVFANMKIADFEQHAIEKAKSEEQNVYEIRVVVEESCILKAARAFLVFKALEDIGDVIKSVPEVQDIEDEKFEQDFSVLIITKESADTVRSAILSISEIAKAIVRPFDLGASQGDKAGDKALDEENTKNEKEKATSGATATATAPAAKKQNAADKKAASKPVVNRSVRVDIEKLDVLMNLVSELIIAKNGLVSLNAGGEESKSNNSFNEQIEYLERVTTNLHESVMKVRMMPIESVVNKFPRMIRDLTKKLDKKMELYMTGEETELDRTVIDEIGDPLMHLLRNSADHGLESNEDRIKAGKPEVGSIFLDAYQDGNNVVIEVRDDGAGIDLEKVKNKAIEKGVITDEQAETMTDNDLISLLFKPSFSTADKVTDVSGRGVGLDVVKSKIEGLGGDIECKTVRGEGSTFTIRLPLTLAIITALMVELGDEKYAIPLGSIQTIEDIPCTDVKYVQGREVINLRGTVIPLIRLDSILDVQPREEVPESLTVVIVAKGEKLAGLVVDNLIGQQEIVIKSIGKYINNNKIISGATILGDGEVALIIDANTLV
ncbi:MAG: chemotaxis protein CheA [Lachnospiraceae bacterium]|nr:chemotaxis protein CheA [Lachnospiraceae bacterium]